MKHGVKLRKLQRTPSHRWALLRWVIRPVQPCDTLRRSSQNLILRNLVSALLHHEMIRTTLPKAKEAARMAEKVCGFGKPKDLWG